MLCAGAKFAGAPPATVGFGTKEPAATLPRISAVFPTASAGGVVSLSSSRLNDCDGSSYGCGEPPLVANGLKSASVGITPRDRFVPRFLSPTPVSIAINGSAENPLTAILV